MRSDLKIRTTVNSTISAPPPPDALENVLDSESPCCASNGSSCFKENININRSETPNLSLEPLQMKRKKKGGGYNLRKSLAWNRAFFTEEGVLDPRELSAISGGSCREGLPFIDKDATGGSLLPIKLENDLVKELQEEDLSKDGKKDLSSSKLDSSSSNFTTSTSLTSIKVPTKPGSRFSDCLRPLPSSSLKRPAMVNVGKAAGKDLKLPKVPGLRPGTSPICATTRSTILRANRVKHNQITGPDFNIQRNAGSKSSSRSLKNTQNESKASSLRSTHYSDGISDNSSFRRHSSNNMSPMLVEKANNAGSEMISSSLTPANQVNSSEGQRESANFANAHVSGRTVPSQNQMMKPSGLRMPSPSLSFFSQPKASVRCDLSLGDTETDVCGSRKPEISRLQGSLRRTPETDNRITQSISSVSRVTRVTNSRSECMASSHVSAPDVLKPDLERNSEQKGVVEVLYGNPVTSESRLEQNYAIHEFETISAIDDASKGKNRCNSLVRNNGAIIGTQCEDALGHKVQNSLKTQRGQVEPCKPDCCETHREQTDPFKYSLEETHVRTDKDNNVLKTKGIASEQLGLFKLDGSSYSRSASSEASVHREPMAESIYSGSKHLHEDRLEDAAFVEVLTGNLSEGETHIQNAIFASTTGGFKNIISEISEVGKQSVVQNKVEIEPQGSIELNTTEGLLPEKQICLQIFQQEENVRELLSVFPDRKYGNKMIDTQMTSSRSSHKMHDFEFDKEKISQPLIFTEFDCVGNPVSCESPNNLVNTTSNHDGKHNGITNGSLSGPANKNMPDSLHQDTQRAEIDYCSSFPESTTHEMSQKNTSRKMTEVGPIIPDGSASNQSSSTRSVKENESDMGNLINKQDSATVLVQSPESNMLMECCSNQSEPLASPIAEFAAENLNERLHVENYLQTESPVDVSHEYNALEIMEDSVTGQKEICVSISRSSSVSASDSPIEHGSCSDGYGTGGHMVDAVTEPSRTSPSSDTSEREVSEDDNSSFSCLRELDHVKVEAVSAQNNKLEVGLNEKCCLLVPPPNAIPFSDEWLAAIEAAGEDILTRKGGAVQNSPPDKSLPEPSPWSPVRKKNNQIGPFDCTKYTNIDPCDSN